MGRLRAHIRKSHATNGAAPMAAPSGLALALREKQLVSGLPLAVETKVRKMRKDLECHRVTDAIPSGTAPS